MKKEIIEATIFLRIENKKGSIFSDFFMVHYWGFIPYGATSRMRGPRYHPTATLRYY